MNFHLGHCIFRILANLNSFLLINEYNVRQVSQKFLTQNRVVNKLS
jgi:hypothetical protein